MWLQKKLGQMSSHLFLKKYIYFSTHSWWFNRWWLRRITIPYNFKETVNFKIMWIHVSNSLKNVNHLKCCKSLIKIKYIFIRLLRFMLYKNFGLKVVFWFYEDYEKYASIQKWKINILKIKLFLIISVTWSWFGSGFESEKKK